MTASSCISFLFVLALAGYAVATTDLARSKSFPSDLKGLNEYSKVKEQTELASAILEMANEFGKVENYSSSEYIWDKISKKPKDTSSRAKLESAFLDAIKYYVDEKLPADLKTYIFGDNVPSSFKIRTVVTEIQQSDQIQSHSRKVLNAVRKSVKIGDKAQVPAVKENPEISMILKAARKLSFFFMEQLNLFAILENYNIVGELITWMRARSNIYKSHQFNNPTYNNSLHKGTDNKGQTMTEDEIEALKYINHVVYEVSEIGPRQQEYVFFIQDGRRSGSFKEEEFPQMHIISGERLTKDDEFGTDLYSAKRLVEQLFAEHTMYQRWEESKGESLNIQKYLSLV